MDEPNNYRSKEARKDVAGRDGEMGTIACSPHLESLLSEALKDANFSKQWADPADYTFRSFAIATFELRQAEQLSLNERQYLIRDLCLRSRKDVLAEVLGKPVAPRIVRWLGRIEWMRFSRDDWSMFFSIATMEGTASPLGHVRRITPILVSQFTSIPEKLRVAGILNVASGLRLSAERWEKLYRFIARRDDATRARVLRSAKTVKTNADLWDFYFDCSRKPFVIPESLRESVVLEPFDSPEEMEAEGRRMHNCLALRVTDVQRGRRIYFRLRGGASANAELIRREQGWVPGEILGPHNSPVQRDPARSIRTELGRLARSMAFDHGASNAEQEVGTIATLRQTARNLFDSESIENLGGPLKTIQGRSLSWTNGAYVIIEVTNGAYVQFMSSPDGTEYLCEIVSHKYNPGIDEFLTAQVVDLLEGSGFGWPTGRANLMRWFDVLSEDDFRLMAEITLAFLARVFQHQAGADITISTHIPS